MTMNWYLSYTYLLYDEIDIYHIYYMTMNWYLIYFSIFQFSYLYFIAFSGIFIGLIIYNIKPTPTAPSKKKKKKDLNLNTIATEEITHSFFMNDPAPLLNGNVPSHQGYGSTSPILRNSINFGENSFKISGIFKDYIIKYTKL